MEKRRLGMTDLSTSVLGFGCASIGSRASRRDAVDAVSQAFDLGVNFYDTAPFYGQGESEKILGEVFRDRRDEVVIATKVGIYPSAMLRLASKLRPIVRIALRSIPGGGRSSVRKGVQAFTLSNSDVQFDRQSMVKSVGDSLRRLRSERIDLLLLHATPKPEEIDDVVDELQALQRAGKIAHYGASSHGYDEVLLWLQREATGISALQVMLNMFEIETLDRCLSLAPQSGIAIIAREPFARGRLVPTRATSPGHLEFVGQEYDPRFDRLAIEAGRTVPQLAIQFLVQTPGISSVLAGMSSTKHLLENAASLGMPRLTSEQVARIRALASA
jgi:aryl-alcohol dehydrogenase-like predicted oxidoreductase